MINVTENRCMACWACENVCPVNAIKIEINENGYYRPQIDNSACIGCDRCNAVCPEMNPPDNSNYDSPQCYALWADDAVRWKSSSGGAFSLLAEHIIDQGGVVFGCAFSDDFTAIHISIDNKDEITKLRKSKYIQSNIGKSYREAEEYLNNGRKVLFTGLPCQIAGLKNVIGNTDENLYTVDLVCTNSNPAGVWSIPVIQK